MISIEKCNIAKRIVLASTLLWVTGTASFSQLVAHFPMDLKEGKITETVSGESYVVTGNHAPENIAGAEGRALRLDGYSSYISAGINAAGLNPQALTFSMWCAMETYPMMNNEGAVNTSGFLAGNMDDSQNSGFAFLLSSQGDYSFEFYVEGWKVSCKADDKLQKYTWNHLAAVVDMSVKEVRLYLNGQPVKSVPIKIDGNIVGGKNTFMIGKSFENVKSGPFLLNTMNGLIDDIRIYNKSLTASELDYKTPEHLSDLSIPSGRFSNDILRPIYHSMPAAAWTNEPHGLTYYGGKYHLFFQKNANGPYWGRLHWGHVTSENLYDWKEEKIALAPSVSYDWKGCWSGCVFTDPVLTGGMPYIYYTAVDNAKATIAEAAPEDGQLIDWAKDSRNPIINGRPNGLSDDFRDPYMFTFGGEYYMIVGTSKGGVGATTLHRYDKVNKTWSNDGSIFFKGDNANIAGTFWEMPVIVPMKDNKWLFMATPLGTRHGVEVLYWVGTLNSDATFSPLPAYQNEPKEMELSGMSEQGYGLLSPSLYQVEAGKYIAIGIVPDKLNSEYNYSLGWAHTFSLPRELTLDENDLLVQKPYSGLTGMRSTTVTYTAADFVLEGARDLAPVSGRCVEVRAGFKVNTANKVGLRFFKDGNKAVEVYYTPSSNKLTVDARNVERWKNDEGSFNGVYESVLPSRLPAGSEMDLRVYVDHSIMDIFINDKWAFSIRLFPTGSTATGVEAFSEGTATEFSRLDAWILEPGSFGGGTWIPENSSGSNGKLYTMGNLLKYEGLPVGAFVSFYNLSGQILGQSRVSDISGTLQSPASGGCIVTVTAPGINFSEKMIFRSW